MPTMPSDNPPPGRRVADTAEPHPHPADHRAGGPAPLVTISASCGAGGSVIGPRLAERLGLPFIDRAFSSQVRAEAAVGGGAAGVAGGGADAWSAGGNGPGGSDGSAGGSGGAPGGVVAGPDGVAGPGGWPGGVAGPGGSGRTSGWPTGRSTERLTKEEEAVTPSNRFFAYMARAAGVGGMLSPEMVVDEEDSIRREAEADLVALAEGEGGVLLGRAGAIVLAQRRRAFHIRLDGPKFRRIQRAAELEHVDLAVAAEHVAEADRARTLYVRRLYRADPTDERWYHLRLDTTVLPLERCVDVLETAVTAFLDKH